MKIGIVVGEHSGDALGAGLINALRETIPNLQITGIGGPKLIAAGCKNLYEMEKLSMMGIIEPLFHLRELLKIRQGLYKYFLKNPPDVFIGIDSPDFNLGLECKLRKAKIPVVHYVSPSVWAWRKKRIFKIAKAVDLMLALFPFETKIYEKHNIPVRFVGHPLADEIALMPNKQKAREKLDLELNKTYIAILPGSRGTEIKHLARLYISAAHRIWKLRPEIGFITAAANNKRGEEFKKMWMHLVPQIPIKFFVNETRSVLEAADIAIVTSGTVTLETMLYKRPMVIAFKTGKLSYLIAKNLIDVPFIGLPNLIANEKIVPEFIQADATPEKLVLAVFNFLDNQSLVKNIEDKFSELHLKLQCNANKNASDAVLQLMKDKNIL